MVDAAIERIAREHGLSNGNEAAYPLALPMKPTRLRWKGLDVSEEFKAYADRVGRGEDLPPFEGRVLAEPNPAFPWGPSSTAALPAKKSGAPRIALWGSALVVLGLLGWSVGLKLEADARDAAASAAALEQAFAAAPSDARNSASSGSVSDGALPGRASEPLPHDVVDTQVTARTAGQPAGELGAAEPSSGTSSASESGDEARNLAALDTAPPDTMPSQAMPSQAISSQAMPAHVASPSPVAAGAVGSGVGVSSSGTAVSPAPVVARAPLAPSAAVSSPVAAGAAPSSAAPAISKDLLAAHAAPAADPARAAGSKPIEDDFGIEATPASAAAAAKTAPAVGVGTGDLAKAGQGSGANVRKEPGSESSAKGSLLVENPSF
jgi:hypothetical protein